MGKMMLNIELPGRRNRGRTQRRFVDGVKGDRHWGQATV